MTFLFWSAVSLQGGLMFIDEFYFHWKRGLPKWERVGHPIDTFVFLLALGILSFRRPLPFWQTTYVVVAVLSCLIITKDEKIHLQKASALEQWLHALLFILHPTVLIAAYFVWTQSAAPFVWIGSAILTFWFYQIIFWNFYADRRHKNRILKT